MRTVWPRWWRAAMSVALASAAGGTAAWRAEDLNGWCSALTALGGVALAASLAARSRRGAVAGLVMAAAAVAVGLVERTGGDGAAPLEGAALLLAAEMAWWSLELGHSVAVERGVDRARWVMLGAVISGGIGLGAASLGAAGPATRSAARTSGPALEVLGVAAAVVLTGLAALLHDRR